jgi:hypothetical protein
LPDSVANGLCNQNAPIICQEKAVLHFSYYAMHYKHVQCAFLKLNKLFKGLTIVVDAQIFSLMLLKEGVLKNMCPTIRVAVMAQSQLICCSL